MQGHGIYTGNVNELQIALKYIAVISFHITAAGNKEHEYRQHKDNSKSS